MRADPAAVVAVYRELARLGLNNGSSGNVSQRGRRA
jgi:ribulose-5-phosphate 4-epimerase/fuculose-1-phosphate aldolase